MSSSSLPTLQVLQLCAKAIDLAILLEKEPVQLPQLLLQFIRSSIVRYTEFSLYFRFLLAEPVLLESMMRFLPVTRLEAVWLSLASSSTYFNRAASLMLLLSFL